MRIGAGLTHAEYLDSPRGWVAWMLAIDGAWQEAEAAATERAARRG